MGLNENEIKCFETIKEFIENLHGQFGDNKTGSPLTLYSRLISKIELQENTPEDKRNKIEECMSKVLVNFRSFFDSVGDNICSHESLDRYLTENKNIKILYGDKQNIYVNISNFYTRQENPKQVIREYLLIIYSFIGEDEKVEKVNKELALLSPSPSHEGDDDINTMLSSLDIDTKSAEGMFVKNIVDKVSSATLNVDMADPMTAIASLMGSGALTDIMESFSGDGKNQLSSKGMMKMMKGLLNKLVPEEDDDEEENENEKGGATVEEHVE